MSKLAKYLMLDLEEDWTKPSIKFLKKGTSLVDKRKTIITPSNITIEEYKVWSENFIKSVV